MNGDKWYVSKRLWAAVIAVGAMIMGLFGYQIDEETQAVILNHTEAIVMAVMSIVAGVLGVWSKIRSIKK